MRRPGEPGGGKLLGAAAVHDLAEDAVRSMLPAMRAIAATMLGWLPLGHTDDSWKGRVLRALCAVYPAVLFVHNPGSTARAARERRLERWT